MLDILLSYQTNHFEAYGVLSQYSKEVDASTKSFRETVTRKGLVRSQSSFLPVSPTLGQNALIFAVPLATLLQREQTKVPKLVSQVFEWIEANALEVEGLYRLAGIRDQPEKVRKMYDRNPEFKLSELTLSTTDVHWICNLCKLFLRLLPDPVIPFAFYSRFVEIDDIKEEEEKTLALAKLIKLMPEEHKTLLEAIVHHSQVVANSSSKNMMDSHNLALVLSPTMLKAEKPNMSTMVAEIEKGNRVFSLLFKKGMEVFSQKSEENSEVPTEGLETQILAPLSPLKTSARSSVDESVSSPRSQISSRTQSSSRLIEEQTRIIEEEKKLEEEQEEKKNEETPAESLKEEEKDTSESLVQNEQGNDESFIESPDNLAENLEEESKGQDSQSEYPTPVAIQLSAEMENALASIRSNTKEFLSIVSKANMEESEGTSIPPSTELDNSFHGRFYGSMTRYGMSDQINSKERSKNVGLLINLHPLAESLIHFIKLEWDWNAPTSLEISGKPLKALMRSLEHTIIDIQSRKESETQNEMVQQLDADIMDTLTSANRLLVALKGVWNEQQSNKISSNTSTIVKSGSSSGKKFYDALVLGVKVFTASCSNLLWDLEQEKEKKELAEIAQSAQVVINAASSILRSIYSGSGEHMDGLCSELDNSVVKFDECVKDRLPVLFYQELQHKSHKSLDTVSNCAKELSFLAKSTSSRDEEFKTRITTSTKKLMEAIKVVTSAFFENVGSEKHKDVDIYSRAYQLLSQVIFSHSEDWNEIHRPILGYTKTLASEVLKLKNGMFSLPDQYKVLEKLVATTSKVMQSTQGLVEDCIFSSMSAISDSDQQTALDFGNQINSLGFTLDRFLLHIKFFTSSLLLRMQPSNVERITLPEAVGELASAVFSIINMYSSYQTYSSKNDNDMEELLAQIEQEAHFRAESLR
eukprot:TRINITY_DN3993_c0_g1_i1.p1 TRINITY_DN3993_c0_g1~~TRINITY_DN3993_c0_g1_i1.p1  ORF type:complete len:925 (+),score=337.42 TRINITY_DN3993_c0_g1_i1:928-3702(+)